MKWMLFCSKISDWKEINLYFHRRFSPTFFNFFKRNSFFILINVWLTFNYRGFWNLKKISDTFFLFLPNICQLDLKDGEFEICKKYFLTSIHVFPNMLSFDLFSHQVTRHTAKDDVFMFRHSIWQNLFQKRNFFK